MKKLPNNSYLQIGQVSKILGISKDTLRRWEAVGKISSERSPSGYRLYDLNKVIASFKGKKIEKVIKRPKAQNTVYSIPVYQPQTETPKVSLESNYLSKGSDYYQDVDLNPKLIQSVTKEPNLEEHLEEQFGLSQTANYGREMLKRKVVFAVLTSFLLFFLVGTFFTASLLGFYTVAPVQTKEFFARSNDNKVYQSISSALSPFNSFAIGALRVIDPKLVKTYALHAPPGKTLSDNLIIQGQSGDDRISPLSGGQVLAESTEAGRFIQFNLGIAGTEATFSGELTAPNIIYSLTPGANISITGDPQRPIIASTVNVETATNTVLGIASFSSSFFTVTSGAVSISDGSITATQIKDSTITNAKLSSPSITVTAGSGLSGGGSVSLGGSVSIASVLGSTVSLTSEVEGVLPVANGGTGISTTPTAGGIAYGTGSVFGWSDAGTSGQVLTSSGTGAPTWSTVAGVGCPTCVFTNPSATQTITPTVATAIGLSIAQAASGSVDIFNVSNNGGTTKYFKVDSTGNTTIEGSTNNTGTFTSSSTLTASNGFTMTTGALNLTSTSGAFSATLTTTNKATIASSTTNSDTIQIQPQSSTATNTFNGIITSSDLTVSDKTWTFPNASGTVAVSATSPVTLSVLGDIGCSTCLVSGGSLWTAGATSGTTTQTVSQGGTLTFTAGTDITTTGAAGTITFDNTSTLATVTGRGATTTTLVNLNGGIAVDTTNFTVDGTTGAVVTASTITAATDETINGIDISSGSISDVVGFTQASGAFSATGLSSGSISVTSANLALATVTSGNITLTTGATTGLVNVLTGNLKVGSGTPGVTQDGEDAYITGTFEVDGASTFDGTITANTDADFSLAGSENVVITNATNTTAAAGLLDINGTGSTSDSRTLDVSTIFSSTGATTSYGLSNTWASTAVVTGAGISQTGYGLYNTATKTGADDATGTYTLYGSYNTASNTGRTAAGTVNTYGGYFSATGDAAGATTAYGIYATASGADTNYSAAFGDGTDLITFSSVGDLLFIDADGGASITGPAGGALLVSAPATNLNLQSDGTIDVNVAGGSGATGCTFANSTGNLTCSGNITGSSSGTVGFWTRTSTTLSPATANDIVSIANTTTTGADLAITNTGIYTGTGLVALTANSATTGDILTISATALSTGTILTLTGPTSTGVTDHFVKLTSDVGSAASLLNLNPDFSGAGVTGYGIYNLATDATTAANTDYGYYGSLALTGNAAKIATGIYQTITSASTTGDTLVAADLATSATGALSATQTRTNIGLRTQPVSTAASANADDTLNLYGIYNAPSSTLATAGTTNVYGEYIKATATHAADAGTINNYGLYVDNGTSSTNGTSKKYGIYINTQSGADNNYALVTASDAGNVGIGTITPAAQLDILAAALTNTTTPGINLTGTAPASTSGTGTANTAILAVTGAAGQATSGTTFVAGAGQTISLTTGAGGALTAAGAFGTAGAGGALALAGGNGGSSSVAAGAAPGAGGKITLTAGNGGAANASSNGGVGGNVELTGGNAGSNGAANGGSIYLVGGTATGSGIAGKVFLGVTSAATVRGNVVVGYNTQVVGSSTKFDVDGSSVTSGILAQIGAPESAVTVAGSSTPLTGLAVDLSNGYTIANDDVTGQSITLAAATDSDATQDDLFGLTITGGTLTASGGSANPVWEGAKVTLPATTNTDSSTTGIILRGFDVATPALTQTQAEKITMLGFDLSSAGALVQNTNAGTIDYRGANITLPAITQTTGTVTADGLRVTIPASSAITTGGTMNAINVVAPTTSGPAAGTLVGVNIGNLTSAGSATETALSIGSGWDNDIYFEKGSSTDVILRVTAASGADRILTIPQLTADATVCVSGQTCATSGSVGYWSRATTTLSPATANDIVSIANTTTTGADLAITNTGIYTGTGIVNLTADSATAGTLLALSADGITTGKGIDLTSTSNALDSATLLNVSHSATAATDTSLSADIANLSFSPTYSTAVTTPAISGNVLDISRTSTTNALFASTLTVSGALVSLSDSATQTTGTLTHTASVLDLTQNYTSSTGTALYVKSYGGDTGYAFRADDVSGDTTPFVIENTGEVGIGTATPSTLLHVYGSSSTFTLEDSGNAGLLFNITNTLPSGLFPRTIFKGGMNASDLNWVMRFAANYSDSSITIPSGLQLSTNDDANYTNAQTLYFLSGASIHAITSVTESSTDGVPIQIETTASNISTFTTPNLYIDTVANHNAVGIGKNSTAAQLDIQSAASFLGFQLRGTAASSTAGNGAAAASIMDVLGATGQASSGTTGQTGGAGGAFSLVGGIGGAVAGASGIGGAGGALTLTGGAGGNGAATGGAGGALTIAAGAAGTGGNANGGTLTLNSGAVTGSGTSTLSIASSNTTTLNLGTSSSAATINLGPTSTVGSIVMSGGSADTGCTLDGTTGNLTCSGNITGSSSGTVGFWTRTSTTLSPATANDIVSVTSNSATALLTLSPSGATGTGLAIGALSGATANTGVSIGNITSAATANNYGVNIGTITSQASATSYAINTGAISGAGTATYGINLGANSSTATTNYGINIGAISGAGTTNYGVFVGAVSGASTNISLAFQKENAHTIQIAASTTADTAGGALSILGAAGAATNAAGGAINITGGTGAGSGNGGALVLTGGVNAGSGNGGAISVTAGSASTGTGDGGLLTLAGGAGGSGAGTHDGGGITITTGNSGSNGTAGSINMNVGTSAGAGNGSINIGTAARNQTITIGNTTNTKAITFDSAVATGTTTSSALALNSNALTSGTGLFATSTSITSGKLLDLTTGTANTWTGNGTTNGLINLASSSTAGTGSASSILLNLSRSGANANLAHTAYGVYSAVTNTNVTSGTNIAGYFSASGATTANYGLIVAAGNVGVGDTTPDGTFDVDTINAAPGAGSTYGVNLYANAGTAFSGSLYGISSQAQYTTTGTGANLFSIYGSTANTSTGTVTNAYSLYLDMPTNAGTITNTYGLYIGDVTTGTQTNTAYGLYSSDATAYNYFAGNIGIGDTTPTAALVVGSGEKFTVASTGNVTLADGVLMDLSATPGAAVSATEGLKLPQATDCTAQTAEGLICWDSDNDTLRVGNATTTTAFTASPFTVAAGVIDYATATDRLKLTVGEVGDIGLEVLGKANQTAAGILIDAATNAYAGTSGALDINMTSSTTNSSAADILTTFTSTGATTSYGTKNAWASTAVVTGAAVSQTAYGLYNTATKTGADDATGTYTLYGSYNTASNTGRTAAGTVNTYGGYFSATGDSAGTTTTYGVYADASGADKNYAGYFSNGSGQNGPFLANSTGLADTLIDSSLSTVAANGYVYVLGGIEGGGAFSTTTTQYAKINANGTIGSFSTTTALPVAKSGEVTVAANGYIYAIAGQNGTNTPVATVYYAKLNTDGTIGSWSTGTSIPASLKYVSGTYSNGYIYILGGENGSGFEVTSVYYAKVNADGSVGTWVTNSNTLPAERANGSVVVANGYIYYIGGQDIFDAQQEEVYYAALNTNGSVAAFSTGTAIPAVRDANTAVVINGYIYVMGGLNASAVSQTSVYYAKPASDGTVTWTTSANTLSTATGLATGFAANGYMYIMGGINASDVRISTIQYASTTRTTFATNLDLVGATGQNLANRSGDVGGSVYAGSVFANNNLEVIGNTQLWSGLSVLGATSIADSTLASVSSGSGSDATGILSVVGASGQATTATGNVDGGAGSAIGFTTGAGGSTAGANASANGGTGGAFAITTGAGGANTATTIGSTAGTGGALTFLLGNGGANASTNASAKGGVGGAFSLTTGTGGAETGNLNAVTGGAGGALTLTTGTGGAGSASSTGIGGAGGTLSLTGGNGGNGGASGTGGIGGAITLTAGNAGTGGNANGGTLTLNSGAITGTGTSTINLGTSNTTAMSIGSSALTSAIAITSGATTNDALTLAAASITSGQALQIDGPTATGVTAAFTQITTDVGAAGAALKLVPDFSGSAATGYGLYNTATDATANANTDYGYYGSLTLTGNAAKTGYGIYQTITSTSNVGDTLRGIDVLVDHNAATVSGNKTISAIRGTVTNDGITDAAGTHNLYGGVFTATGNTGGTQSTFGVYVQAASGATGYGIYIEDGTATTDYGVYQAGATDDNYFAGNVGIGVAPVAKLQTSNGLSTGSLDAANFTEYQILLYNGGTPGTSYGFGVETSGMVLYQSSSGGAGHTWYSGTVNTMILDQSGNLTVGNFASANTAAVCYDGSGGSALTDCSGTPVDLAENYGTQDSSIEAGDLVVATGEAQEVITTDDHGNQTQTSKAWITKSSTPYDSKILGIISTQPNQVYGEDGVFDPSENPKPVSLTGRVPTKVSTENGPIEKGDYLTTSSTPGVAMKATRPGPTVGKALASYNGAGIGKIVVFVNVSYADPSDALANMTLDTDGSLIVPKLKVASLTLGSEINAVTVKANPVSIDASTLNLTGTLASVPVASDNKVSLADAINIISTKIQDTSNKLDQYEASNSAQLASAKSLAEQAVTSTNTLGEKVASTSANLASLSSQIDSLLASFGMTQNDSASQDSGLSDTLTSSGTQSPSESSGLTPPSLLTATGSATLAELTVTSEATFSGKLLAYQGIFQDTLKSLGNTFLGNTTIAGDLSVNGTLSITEGNKVNAIGTLFLQDSVLAEAVDLFNGKVTIDKTGLVSAESLALGGQSLGEATIPAGQTEIQIPSNLIKPDSKVFVTPTTTILGSLFVIEITPGENFKVRVTQSNPADIKFNWMVVQTKTTASN